MLTKEEKNYYEIIIRTLREIRKDFQELNKESEKNVKN